MALLALLKVGSLEKVDLYDICLGGLFADRYAQISILILARCRLMMFVFLFVGKFDKLFPALERKSSNQ
jgi:hypothetical protein